MSNEVKTNVSCGQCKYVKYDDKQPMMAWLKIEENRIKETMPLASLPYCGNTKSPEYGHGVADSSRHVCGFGKWYYEE